MGRSYTLVSLLLLEVYSVILNDYNCSIIVVKSYRIDPLVGVDWEGSQRGESIRSYDTFMVPSSGDSRESALGRDSACVSTCRSHSFVRRTLQKKIPLVEMGSPLRSAAFPKKENRTLKGVRVEHAGMN